jgi:hypothetical protein
MTISSIKSKESFEGNGSTTEFQIDFMFLRDEDVEVVLKDEAGTESVQAAGTDYQLSGVGEVAGGTCRMTVPPAVGQSLYLRRVPAIVQETDYPENDAFPAASHEAALDYLTMICQALSERLDRTISFRVSSAVTGVSLPEPDPDRVLAWDGTGDDLENRDVLACGNILVPVSVAQGGTGADNVTEALFNLGFGVMGAALAGCESGSEAVEALDPDLLRADIPDLLRAAYGDEAQSHAGTDLSGLAVVRNHISWTLTADSQFSDVALPYDGTYVFHVYPATHDLALAASYKTDGSLPDPDSGAGEIRIAVEQYGGRKTIVSLQNMEA